MHTNTAEETHAKKIAKDFHGYILKLSPIGYPEDGDLWVSCIKSEA